MAAPEDAARPRAASGIYEALGMPSLGRQQLARRRLVMPIPVQTSFGVALLPLPVAWDPEDHPGRRGRASERAREDAYYAAFPDGGSPEKTRRGSAASSAKRRPVSEWPIFVGLVSWRRWLSQRVWWARWGSRKVPSYRG